MVSFFDNSHTSPKILDLITQIDWQKRFELDVYYVRNWSFFLDMKILLLTLRSVVKAKDITPEKSQFMPGFKRDE